MFSESITLAFIFDSLGGGEMFFVFLLILMLFGGQKLPEFARGLGKSIREFKKAAAGVEDEIKKAMDAEPEPPQPAIKPPAAITDSSKTPQDNS